MPEEGKKSGILPQIIVAVVIAMCVGGTSPWWFKEIFLPKSDQAQAETPRASDAKPAANDDLSKLDKADLANRQKQLEDELRELKRDQQQAPQPRSAKAQSVNIDGAWQGGGSSYIFHQTGGDLTIEETTPGYGKTAIGEGTITKRDVTVNIQTALGTRGLLQLTLSDDGRQLSGTYTDYSLNTSLPYVLTR